MKELEQLKNLYPQTLELKKNWYSPIADAYNKQDLRNWHISRVSQISNICLFAGFMKSDAP
ncbi:hypothetical protein [Anabaena azotica]|uniref:hypothetical protein n=1 Tax=Anabaena azotica TaxID=197653 RepID=UPI0039A5F164